MIERIDAVDRLARALALLLWPQDPDARFAISIVCGLSLVAFATLYLPSLWRLIRLKRLSRRLDEILGSDTPLAERREEVATAFGNSPARSLGADFIERWKGARPDPAVEVSSARISDLLEERPLLPRGPRSSILAALPSLLLAIGVLATFVALTHTLSEATPVSSDRAVVEQSSEPGSPQIVGDLRARQSWDTERLAHRITLALHASLWGILLCLLSGLAIRWLEGGELACGDAISESMGRIFPSLSKSEAAAFAVQARSRRDEQLAERMTEVQTSFMTRLEAGLGRIEEAMRHSVGAVSEDPREELGEDLTRALKQVNSTLERFSEIVEDTGRKIETVNAGAPASASEQAQPNPAAERSSEENAEGMGYANLYRQSPAARTSYSPPRQRPAVENAPLRGLSGLLSTAPVADGDPSSRRGDEDPED